MRKTLSWYCLNLKKFLPLLILLLVSFFSAGFQPFCGATKADQAGTVVYVFLMEDCPISQSYTPALKVLHQSYGFEFIGVFANASSTEETMQTFQKKYAIPFSLKLDADNKISQALGAQITPEVFALDKATEKILYQGRIDNTFFSLGSRRGVTTSHDLREALEAIKTGKPIAVAKTEAIGCLITPRKN